MWICCARLSLIDESGERRVRMAHLAVAGSHKVNGVSALHSGLLVQTIFADFADLWPERFTNVTNGVTPRRWLAQANPGLTALLDDTLGRRWRADLTELARLRRQASDTRLQDAFMQVKRANKERLADLVLRQTGHRGRPGQPLRRAGQAHPRVQAPAPQRAARRHPLPAPSWRSPKARTAVAGCRAP